MGAVDWWLNHPAGELAGWWEKNRKESDKVLDEFVDAHPHWWVVAAVTTTAMHVGAGYGRPASFRRRGCGIPSNRQDCAPSSGCLSGGGIATSAGGVIKKARSLAGKIVGLYADAGGNICAPLSVGNAVRRTGQRFLLSLDEIAQAHGVPGISSVQGLTMTQSIAALRRLGTAFEEIPGAGSLENLSNTARRGGGVVMFRVVDKVTGEGHRILLEKAGAGVQIVDRTGFYQSLRDLSAHYGRNFAVDPAAPAVFLKNAMSKLVNGLPTLMTYANGLTVKLAANKTLPELDAKSREFKSQKSGSAGPATAGVTTIVVSPGDTLSRLAPKKYGSVEYWPLLWDANRGVVGPNPNAIRPGMMLLIPPLAGFTPAQLQDTKRRFPT
jgi:hypothetical protein